jgi:hypothetical protein
MFLVRCERCCLDESPKLVANAVGPKSDSRSRIRSEHCFYSVADPDPGSGAF